MLRDLNKYSLLHKPTMVQIISREDSEVPIISPLERTISFEQKHFTKCCPLFMIEIKLNLLVQIFIATVI